MIMTEHGKVQGGGIVFEKPLTLPAGTEVVVRIEPLPSLSIVGETPATKGLLTRAEKEFGP